MGTFESAASPCHAGRMTTPSNPVEVPQLEMLWTTPPPYIGTVGGGTGSGSAPEVPEIDVSLATVQSAESAMLAAEATIVGEYNALVPDVKAAVDSASFYGQEATYSMSIPGGDLQTVEVMPDTNLQQSAQQYAAQINPVMSQVLALVAAATEACGIFTALLDKAGQMYASADTSSALPYAPANYTSSVPPA